MSTPDQSLADESPDTPVKVPTLSEAAVENILTLERVMESARLVERKATICLAGDLEVAYSDLMTELSTLVDEDGNLVGSGETTLDDQRVARAEELQRLLEENRKARLAASYIVKFQAMPADEWAEFEKSQRQDGDSRRPVKNIRDYERKLIARCAIEPKMTEEQVDELRKRLTAPQMDHLFEMAYSACTTGGLDVPKSLSFSLSPRP